MTSRTTVVGEALAGERLDRAVATLTGASRSRADNLVAEGLVRIHGAVCGQRARRLVAGDAVTVEVDDKSGDARPRPDPSVVVPVIHADADTLVVDKPAGLVCHPGQGHPDQTLVNGLLASHPELADVGDPARPGIVHRLDRGTSGLLVVARSPAGYDALKRALAEHRVRREYLALVEGAPDDERGIVEAPIGRSPRDPTRRAVVADGRWARTHYTVQRRFSDPGPAALLTCRLETGRTHQIRVHLASIGLPVVGDTRYGARGTPGATRPWLHATGLALEHPVTGEALSFASEPPPDLVAVRDRWR